MQCKHPRVKDGKETDWLMGLQMQMYGMEWRGHHGNETSAAAGEFEQKKESTSETVGPGGRDSGDRDRNVLMLMVGLLED
jgi:hypothetical protein